MLNPSDSEIQEKDLISKGNIALTILSYFK